MLFDVAALLINSAGQGNAAEVSVAPASTSIVQTVATNPRAILPGQTSTSVEIGVDARSVVQGVPLSIAGVVPVSVFSVQSFSNAELSAMTGTTLLEALSALPEWRIESYASAKPGAIADFAANPPKAAEVTAFWAAATADTTTKLETALPQVVANLDGVPADVRNRIGRQAMASMTSTLTADIQQENGRAVAEDARHQLHMIGAVQKALKTPKGDPTRTLYGIDPTGQGKASVVVGDLATADYVTFMVPGMFFKVDGQIDDWANDATTLYKQQKAWLKLFGDDKSVAVVAWMGYQTPDLTNIGSLDLANQGRDALTSAVEGLQSLREGNEPYTTIVAHSYGSTAALMALTEGDFSVDALALVGSPGSAAQSVNDLNVTNANVFVGAAAWDPVPNSAWFGSDPASPGYGAKPMSVDGETDPITRVKLGQSIGHNEYFSAGSESMRNMALIGINRGELVD